MSLTTSEMTPADIRACTCGNDGYGDGMFGGNGAWWIIILLLFGWGRNGFGGFGGFGGQGDCGCNPCATQADVRAAVDQQTLISKLDQQTYGLADSTYALNNAITNGFHGVDSAICNLGYNIQSGFNGLSHQLSDCCCDTRAAIADVKYSNERNTCAIQNTLQNTTRDVIENANANSRAILDFMVQSKLADKDAKIAMLEGQVARAEQNAFITANQEAQTAELIRRLDPHPCPQPAYVVQPPQQVTFPTNCCGGVNYASYNACGCNGSF